MIWSFGLLNTFVFGGISGLKKRGWLNRFLIVQRAGNQENRVVFVMLEFTR